MTDSEYITKGPCPACTSSDAFAIYSDGHGHCFSCGHHTPPTNGEPTTAHRRKPMPKELIPVGDIASLPKRNISEETCQKFGYFKATFKDRPVQVAPYFNAEGTMVAQKVRFPDKDFTFLGSPKEALLFGQQLWRDGGKMVVITEGEIDALTVSQLQGNKWPVVSVQNGAQGARKSLAKQIEWLNRFESVVLMFDNDDPGKAAAQDCVSLFPPGKCKIARLPLKDPNEMLLAGRGGEVIDAIWSAKVYRPDGIVQLSDLRESILRKPDEGLPWCFPTLTELTFGRRTGEVVALGAGTGIGKTDVITQQVEFDLNTLKQPVAVIFLEQQPTETGKRIAGKAAGRRFHVPDGSWTQEELMGSLSKLEGSAPLYLYDHFGSAEWDTIRDRIRYLAHSEGVRLFYLDHLTALAAEAEDERKALEEIMAQIGGLVKELNVWLLLVSHLATPEGKPHEEGGHVAIRHFKGSRSIGFWSHYMIGLERNQQSDNHDEQQTTTVRMLKDRYTGQATGKLFYLGYDAETGRLFERGAPEKNGGDTFSTNEAGDF